MSAQLADRGVRASTFADWKRIDASEGALGGTRGRARTKLETWQELMDVAHSGRPGGPYIEPDPPADPDAPVALHPPEDPPGR